MGTRQNAQRSRVSTYLGPRTFYAKDMERRRIAGQADQQLPPRCTHCRVSWDITMINGVPHCQNHISLGYCTTDCHVDENPDITNCDTPDVGVKRADSE